MSVSAPCRVQLAVLAALVLAGCAGEFDLDGPRATGPHPAGFPECRAESYDFVGEHTLAGLGLDLATPVRPPEPNRPAMIWVTHDLKPRDRGEPGGPAEMTRMLCFEFADGSGGSEWPVDNAWRPPGAAESGRPGIDQPLLLAGLATALLVIGVSLAAFQRRRGARND